MSDEPTPKPDAAAETERVAASGNDTPTETPTATPTATPAETPVQQTVEPTGGTAPRQPRNDFSWVAVVLALIAVALSVVTSFHHAIGFVPGFTALLFSAIGVGMATRHDVGMARSLSAGLLSLFALLLTVYSMGGGTPI